MCFYNEWRWACGWSKFKDFQLKCPKESRIGEVCGLKLVYQTYYILEVCKLCKSMQAKERRIAKLSSDIARWNLEGNRGATIERSALDLHRCQIELQNMRNIHADRDLDLNV